MGESEAESILAEIRSRRKEHRERDNSYWAEDVVEFSKKTKTFFDPEVDEWVEEKQKPEKTCTLDDLRKAFRANTPEDHEQVERDNQALQGISNKDLVTVMAEAYNDGYNFTYELGDLFDRCIAHESRKLKWKDYKFLGEMQVLAKGELRRKWEDIYKNSVNCNRESRILQAVFEIIRRKFRDTIDAKNRNDNVLKHLRSKKSTDKVVSRLQDTIIDLRQENADLKSQIEILQNALEVRRHMFPSEYEERKSTKEKYEEGVQSMFQKALDMANHPEDHIDIVKIYKPKKVRDDDAYNAAMGILE